MIFSITNFENRNGKIPGTLTFDDLKPPITDVISQVAAYLGISGGFDGFCAHVDALNASLGIPKKLSDMGIENPEIAPIVAGALSDPSASGNPIKMTKENTTKLLLECV